MDSARCIPRYKGGRPPKFTLPQRREVKKIAKSHPADHGLPFSTWALSKLAEFLVAEGVVDDISHEGCGSCSARKASPFKVIKTFKQSNDPDYEAREESGARALRHRKAKPKRGDSTVVF